MIIFLRIELKFAFLTVLSKKARRDMYRTKFDFKMAKDTQKSALLLTPVPLHGHGIVFTEIKSKGINAMRIMH